MKSKCLAGKKLSHSISVGALALLLVARTSHSIGLADDLDDLTGYVVLGSATIEEFEGCEWGQEIEFSAGGRVTCKEYGYQYAYYASAVVLVRPMSVAGQTVYSCVMAVEDTLYDVDCSSYVGREIRLHRKLANSDERNIALYARRWLQLLGADGRAEACPASPDMDDPSTWSAELKETVVEQFSAIERAHPSYRSTIADPLFGDWVAKDEWRQAAAASWEAVHVIELLRQWKVRQDGKPRDIE